MMNFKTVTIIGVTGTMGSNIAGIFASFGNAKVYCIGRDINKVKNTIPRIVKSVKADSIREHLIPADFSDLEKCVSESDLIFESSSEDINIKLDIANRIAKCMSNDAISCTGSSGLSITKLAETYPEHLRSHFFGVHMFNPPYSMPLCELISTKYTDKALEQELQVYLSKTLFRTVVPVKDYPAFLANRIGFQFINEAMQYAETYKDNGGIDYIDAILGSFTGRSMAPLMTADFVGLDVHKAIVDNLLNNTSDYANHTFELPNFVNKLIQEKKLGRKSKEGLYKTVCYENDEKHLLVYDINTGKYRDVIHYAFPFSETMKEYIADGNYKEAFETLVHNHSKEAEICIHFLLQYIVYSLYVAKEVGYSIHAADDVMATGFNWCPPLALYQGISSVCDMKKLIRDVLGNELPMDYESLLDEMKPSGYDYRPFFRSDR